MLHQYFYWPNLKKAVYLEFICCSTCQNTKRSDINMENYHLVHLKNSMEYYFGVSTKSLCNTKESKEKLIT